MHRKLARFVAVAAAILAFVPACASRSGSATTAATGGSTTSASAPALLVTAGADRTVAAGTGRYELSVTMTLGNLPSRGVEAGPIGTLPSDLSLSYTGSGAYDVRSGRSSQKLELGSVLIV